MSAVGKRFAIVASRWNEFVVSRLVEGARDELTRYGASHVEVHIVPGSW
ncbi:MAG: 6,7-dimethyl-8-ribityllumazine synthase, partial [Armatimonadetes bacterium OLB18]